MKSVVWFQGRQICPPRRKSRILFYDLAAYFWGDKCNGKGEDVAKVLQAEVSSLNDNG